MVRFGLNNNKNNFVTAIYIRVSTQEQKRDGFSPEYQTHACRKYIQDRGYKEFKIYSDLAVSGTTQHTERPGFTQLLKDAKAGLFNILVFHAFDRLARNSNVAYAMISLLEVYQIKIIECQNNIDTSKDDGRFRMAIYFALSEKEHDQDS